MLLARMFSGILGANSEQPEILGSRDCEQSLSVLVFISESWKRLRAAVG
jgi:hypothetical protein